MNVSLKNQDVCGLICHVCGLICLDIKSLFRQVDSGSCRFISHEGNKVAHKLASFALRHSSDMFWVDFCPWSLVRNDLIQ